MKTQIDNEKVADELRKLFFEALEAVLDPVVMERVEVFRSKNPQFKYDARMLAATAVKEKRALAAERVALAKAPPLPPEATTQLGSSAQDAKSIFSTRPQWF